MPKNTSHPSRITLLRALVSMVLIGAAVYLLVAHWTSLRASLRIAHSAHLGWLMIALGLVILTFLIAAAIYVVLALKPLRYRQTLTVELAAAFANRLLPAGLGSLGLHGVYLYRRQHSAAQATAVVSINNLLGITAHMSLLVVLLIVRPQVFSRLFHYYHGLDWRVAGLVLIVGIAVLSVPKVRRRLTRFGANLASSMRLLHPHDVLTAFCLALTLTATYTLVLTTVARALSTELNILQVFVVFSLGMLVGTATPTPGGLVGTEAGLYTGLVGYGVADARAGAIVVLYRLLTYWLPLLPGCVALLLARHRHLV